MYAIDREQTQLSQELYLPDWEVIDLQAHVKGFHETQVLVIHAKAGSEFSRATLSVSVQRSEISLIWRLTFGMYCAVAVALLTLMNPSVPTLHSGQMGVLVGLYLPLWSITVVLKCICMTAFHCHF